MEDKEALRERIREQGIGAWLTIIKKYSPLEEHPDAPL